MDCIEIVHAQADSGVRVRTHCYPLPSTAIHYCPMLSTVSWLARLESAPAGTIPIKLNLVSLNMKWLKFETTVAPITLSPLDSRCDTLPLGCI